MLLTSEELSDSAAWLAQKPRGDDASEIIASVADFLEVGRQREDESAAGLRDLTSSSEYLPRSEETEKEVGLVSSEVGEKFLFLTGAMIRA